MITPEVLKALSDNLDFDKIAKVYTRSTIDRKGSKRVVSYQSASKKPGKGYMKWGPSGVDTDGNHVWIKTSSLEKAAKINKEELKSYGKHMAASGLAASASGGALGVGVTMAIKKSVKDMGFLKKVILKKMKFLKHPGKVGAAAAGIAGIGGAVGGAGYKFMMGDTKKK